MPHTKLLASGNPIVIDPDQSQLAQLDVSSYRTIRLSAGSGAGSPGPVIVGAAHVDQPDTPHSNLITTLDSFTLAPDEWVSKVYEVPGEVVVFFAQPATPPLAGIGLYFTIYGRAD